MVATSVIEVIARRTERFCHLVSTHGANVPPRVETTRLFSDIYSSGFNGYEK